MSLSISNSNNNTVWHLLKKISFFMPLLFLIIFVNISVDPAHIFKSGKYEESIVKILASGKNVGNLDKNYDHRLMHKFFIESLTSSPDIVVFGSSRYMEIGKNFFPGEKIINNAVPGAELTDFLGLWYCYKKSGLHPKTLVIGIDPWIFNQDYSEELWASIRNDAQNMLQEIAVSPKPINLQLLSPQIRNILSLNYFQRCIEYIKHNKGTSVDFFSTNEEFNPNYTIRINDGRISYNEPNPQSSIEDIRKQIAYHISKHYNFNVPNKDLIYIFEAFINNVRANGTEIIFLLEPMHPEAYKLLSKDYAKKGVFLTEEYLTQSAKKLNIKMLNSFNPNLGKFDYIDFKDGMHVKLDSLQKYLKVN